MKQLLTKTKKGELSTVRLPVVAGITPGGDYETCWFPEDDDMSEVLARYSSEDAARAGHERYAEELGLND